MKFWDSSALVPLLVPENESPRCSKELKRDRELIVWGMTPLELRSALARRRREGLDAQVLTRALRHLVTLKNSWSEVTAWQEVRDRAADLVELHPLSAADACQLAAAVMFAAGQPRKLPFVVLDEKLRSAAVREGFKVLPPK